MSVQDEVEEHVHHAQNPFDKTVAATMAIIAAALAVVSVVGQHFNTEKLLNQQLGSDQWAYYQAKDIRRYTAQVASDTLAAMKADPALTAKYTQDANRYRQQSAEIQNKARDFEKERDRAGGQADRFHLGEIFLEVSIVFCSLAILSKRRPLFVGGVGLALIGAVISATAYWA
jgi:hypothetical protein